MTIDIHTHFIPRDCFDMVDGNGRRFGPSIGKDKSGKDVIVADGVSLGPVVSQVCDPQTRIRDMDRIGLDMQAISINPSSIFYDMEPEDALRLSQRYNNAIAEVINAYPDRFVGVATVPMQDVSKAVAELERTVRRLRFKAVQIISNVNGKNLDEPEFWPFYRKAQELDIPIFMHPYYVTGAERMRKYFLINLVGNPIETAIAVASIIFGGVLDDFPRLKFVFAHGGGAAPFIKGRWEHGYQSVALCRSIPRPPGEYFKLMYFDTLTHSALALAYLVEMAGADKVVLGSDYPFEMGDPNPVATVRNAAGIPAAGKETILEHTATALLKLER